MLKRPREGTDDGFVCFKKSGVGARLEANEPSTVRQRTAGAGIGPLFLYVGRPFQADWQSLLRAIRTNLNGLEICSRGPERVRLESLTYKAEARKPDLRFADSIDRYRFG